MRRGRRWRLQTAAACARPRRERRPVPSRAPTLVWAVPARRSDTPAHERGAAPSLMPSWGRQRGARLGQLRAQMAAEEDMVQFDKDDPDFVAPQPAESIPDYRSEFGLLGSARGVPNPANSAIFRVRRFFDSLNRSDSSPLEERSPAPPDRRSLLLRRYLHRHRLQHSRSTPGRTGAAKPADSPWPSPARGRRQPPLRDVHSTPEVSLGEDALSSASSLTNVSTISSSYVGDELDLDDWEDEPQDEEHYPDQDWLSCERSAAHLTVETRCSSAASSFRSGIHFTARAAATPSSVGSGIQFTVGAGAEPSSYGSGLHFCAPPAMDERDQHAPSTLTEEYGKMLTLEDLKDYNSNCLTAVRELAHHQRSPETRLI
ncbi:uncharacterized protein LOC119099967 isoform X2 [Pollicipes pollicipes]|uniref:uncharacterized protein LOC119099948 isoform X2 n=1 Tax=Pollicipes pollicipes TaxID=41117 RepID=UPI001884FBF8|nr:uncharacterized protein LOC119099948 isoform X2 [Pollicipes pollicipes]XP_037078972.1 uncharacterized protein LOC119099967 isoform X2 [Pollicipes pollicipes]